MSDFASPGNLDIRAIDSSILVLDRLSFVCCFRLDGSELGSAVIGEPTIESFKLDCDPIKRGC